MKTEQEQLIAMLTRVQAEHNVQSQHDGSTEVTVPNFSLIDSTQTDGYYGFFTVWHFDKEGDLFAVASWE